MKQLNNRPNPVCNYKRGKLMYSDLVKEAGFGQPRPLGDILAQTILGAGLVGGMALSAFGVDKAWDEISKAKLHGRLKESFREMYRIHPSLRDEDQNLVVVYFKSLAHHSPSIAEDPLAAGAFIKRVIQMHPEGGPAPSLFGEFANLEKNRAQGMRKDTEAPSKTYRTLLTPLAQAGLTPLVKE